MGAGQSLPSQNQPPSKALHVLRVTPSSPASNTDIEPFFDFVVGFQGDALTNNLDAAELEKIVESHEGQSLSLVVWNSKNHESRGTVFVPSASAIFNLCPACILTTIRFRTYHLQLFQLLLLEHGFSQRPQHTVRTSNPRCLV